MKMVLSHKKIGRSYYYMYPMLKTILSMMSPDIQHHYEVLPTVLARYLIEPYLNKPYLKPISSYQS